MRRNSVLEELRVSGLAVIQEEICCKTSCRWVKLDWKSGGRKEKYLCVICIEVVIQGMRWYESAKRRGIQENSKGPRTEPWVTDHRVKYASGSGSLLLKPNQPYYQDPTRSIVTVQNVGSILSRRASSTQADLSYTVTSWRGGGGVTFALPEYFLLKNAKCGAKKPPFWGI